tara:strand:+ start:1587 stop:2309 length:723 start_codon:yes stop_codon:yes gene_type:complete
MVEVMKKKRRKKKVVKPTQKPTQKQKQKQSVSQVVKINIGDTKRKPIPRTRGSTQKPQVIYQQQPIPLAPTTLSEEIKFKLNKLDQDVAIALMQKSSDHQQRTGNLAGVAAIKRAEGQQGTLVQTETQTEEPILTKSFNLAPVSIKPEVSGETKRRGRPSGSKNKPKAELSAVATPVSTMSDVLPVRADPIVQGTRTIQQRGSEQRPSQDIRELLRPPSAFRREEESNPLLPKQKKNQLN